MYVVFILGGTLMILQNGCNLNWLQPFLTRAPGERTFSKVKVPKSPGSGKA